MSFSENPNNASPNSSFIFAPEAASTPRKPRRTLEFGPPPDTSYLASGVANRPREILKPNALQQQFVPSSPRRRYPQESFSDQGRISSPSHQQHTPDSSLYMNRNRRYAPQQSFAQEDSMAPRPTYRNHPEWLELQQRHDADLHELLQRQLVEREMLPSQSKNLDLKHSVEREGLEFHYDKEEFKLMLKLQHNIKHSLHDSEVFGSVFDNLSHTPNDSELEQNAKFVAFHERIRRYANKSNPSLSSAYGGNASSSFSLDPSHAGMKDEIVNMTLRRRRMLTALGDRAMQTYPSPGNQNAEKRINAQLRRNLTAEIKDVYKKFKTPPNNGAQDSSLASYVIHADDEEVSKAEQFAVEIMTHMLQLAKHEARVTSKCSPRSVNNCVSMYQRGTQEEVEDALVNAWNSLEAKISTNARPTPVAATPTTSMLDRLRMRVIVQLYESEYFLRQAFEKRQNEASCAATGILSDDDFEELDVIHTRLADDIWSAFEILIDNGEAELVKLIVNETPNIISDAIFAIFLQAKGCIEQTLNDRRIDNEPKPLSDSFARIRFAMNVELMKVIASLTSTDEANMTCQEKRLKILQATEKQALFEKYEKIAKAHPCKLQVAESNFAHEMSLLESTHRDQWAKLISSKLQFKTEEIHKLQAANEQLGTGPNASKRIEKQASQLHESVVHPSKENGKANCICTSDQNTHDLSAQRNLQEMENSEMNEMQESLRQWQVARRSLLEAINSDIHKMR